MPQDTSLTPFPKDDFPREKKSSPEYGIVVSDALINRSVGADQIWDRGRGSFFTSQKLFARGRQPIGPYKKEYRGTTQNGEARKGYNNIDWRISSPAPTNISIIKTVLSGSDYMLHVSCLSKEAMHAKSVEKHRLWYEAEANKIRRRVAKTLEAEIPTKNLPWIPENKAELAAYEQYGGTKLPMERGLTKIGEDIFNTSDWDWIRDKLIEDMIETSWMTLLIIDRKDGSTGVKYIPVQDYFEAYVEDENEDPPYQGHYSWMQMDELIPKLQEAYPKITQEELEQIARNSLQHNPRYNAETAFKEADPVTNRYAWYDFQVRVAHFIYKSVDTKYYTKSKKEDGTETYFESEHGKIWNKPNQKTDVFSNCTYYGGTRLVGQNYIVDWGPMQNVPKKGDGSPCSPYIRVSTREASIIERWRPFLDSYQMAQLKYRTFLQTLKPDMTVYDNAILANQDFGHGKMKPAEAVRYAMETGNVMVSTRGDMLNKSSARDGIVPMQRPASTALMEAKVEISFNEEHIKVLAGITPAISASSQQDSKDKLVGVGMQEIQAANNSMYVLMKAIVRIKEKAGKTGIAKTRVKLMYDTTTQDYYIGTVGDEYIHAIQAYKDLSWNQIGLIAKAKPNEQRKQFIYSMITESLRAGRNGQVGITLADAAFAENELENGYPEMAIWYLSVAEDRARRRFEKSRAQSIQQTTDGQMQSAQVTQEAKDRSEQLKSALRMQEDDNKIAKQTQADIVEENNESNNRIKEIVVDNQTTPKPNKIAA